MLGRERYASVPVVSDALCLGGSVKPFNMRIVIGSVESTMSRLYAGSSRLLLKVLAVLWAIVGLHHGYGESPLFLRFCYYPSCQSRA